LRYDKLLKLSQKTAVKNIVVKNRTLTIKQHKKPLSTQDFQEKKIATNVPSKLEQRRKKQKRKLEQGEY